MMSNWFPWKQCPPYCFACRDYPHATDVVNRSTDCRHICYEKICSKTRNSCVKAFEIGYLAWIQTDHSVVVVSNTNCKSPGYWKLNTLFLSEIDYINQIKAIISKVTEKY